MPLETGILINQLDESWPLGADSPSQGDDHLRLIKAVLKNQFPGTGGDGFSTQIVATEADLNFTAGLNSNAQAQLDALVVVDGQLQAQIAALDSVQEAPIDGQRYVRRSGQWIPSKYDMASSADSLIDLDSTDDMLYLTLSSVSPISLRLNPPVAPYGDTVTIEKGAGSGDITPVGVGCSITSLSVISEDETVASFISKDATTWKMIV